MSPSPDPVQRTAVSSPTLEWQRVKSWTAIVPHNVVFQALVTETVLLNIETGIYYGMTGTGSRFFEALRQGRPLESIVQDLVQEFDAPEARIRRDLIKYCSDLLARGLIELIAPDG